MKYNKLYNKRNERLFKRLTESCGCAVTEETIDEGPFDALTDFGGNIKDKVTGKKRGASGFNTSGEAMEDKYDKKLFAHWAFRSNAVCDIYDRLSDQNGKMFKMLMKKSLDFHSVKPFNFEKMFVAEMKNTGALKRNLKSWSKGVDDRVYNIITRAQLKKLNSVLSKHGHSPEKAVGVLFYRTLDETLQEVMEFMGDQDYQEYLENKFLRGRLRTTAGNMLHPKYGRKGERMWKEFVGKAPFQEDPGYRMRDAANAAEYAANAIEDAVDEARSNPVGEMKYNKLYENWQRHLEEELEEELETVVSEDSESDTAMVNLLSQISQKLDGLEDIDTSIDYLIGAMSGETALSAKMKQSTLGRFADASPQMAELIKKYQE